MRIEDIKRPEHENAGEQNYLCWQCEKAFDGCSWSREGIPPKGAKHEKIERKMHNHEPETHDGFYIYECNEFEPEQTKRNPKDTFMDGWYSLAKAFADRAELDYYNSLMLIKRAENGANISDIRYLEAQRNIIGCQDWITEKRKAQIETLVEKNYAEGNTAAKKGSVGDFDDD